MARSARLKSEINSYGIVLKMDCGLNLDECDKNSFITLLGKYKCTGYKVLAYNVTADMICMVLNDLTCDLETAMRRLTVSFVNKFNASHFRKGRVLKDRFTSIPAKDNEQMWQMVFDIHSMGGETNSVNNYLTNEIVDLDVCINWFGSVEAMQFRQTEWAKNNSERLMNQFSNKIQDCELYEYIRNKFAVNPTELKNMKKTDLSSILKDILKCTKASVRQIGRVTTLSLKYLWNFSKSLTQPANKRVKEGAR